MVERYRPSKSVMKKPGQRGPGRPKGTPNKIGVTIKDAILGAGEDVGFVRAVWSEYYKRDDPAGTYKKGQPKKGAYILYYEPTGVGGTRAYLASMAIIKPHSFMGLMGKLLPHTLNVDANIKSEQTVTNRFEAADLKNMSLDQLMASYREAVGLTKALPPKQLTGPSMIEGEVVGSPPQAPAGAATPGTAEATPEPSSSDDDKEEAA